jgi:hypothetical protein
MSNGDSEIPMIASRSILALAIAAGCVGAHAQSTPSAQSRYQQERAACLDGSSHQDRATCLQEAGAALHESKRGGLTSSTQLESNALARCAALPEAYREDCRARVANDSNTEVSGTVQGGGMLKETTTRWVSTPEGEKRVP